MSARDTAGRRNGDSRQVHLNNANRSMLLSEAGRIRALSVKGGAASTTIDIQVNGVSILLNASPASGVVGAGVVVKFLFGGYLVPEGSVLAVTSTQTDALATVAFMQA